MVFPGMTGRTALWCLWQMSVDWTLRKLRVRRG